MYKIKLIALLLVFPAAGSITAHSQAVLDSVIIRENRIQLPYSQYSRDIQILDRTAIAKLPVKSANELLAYAAGVDMRQRGPWGAQSDITIDGSTFDEVLVLVDGVKMSDPQTGHHSMNITVPLAAIERVEVLRGAAARAYGVNAMAGAVNIVTRLPDHNTLEAQVYAGSSFEKDTSTGKTFAGWGIQAAGTIAGKNQAHGFSIAHDQGNGYRYNTAFEHYQLFYQDAITLNKKNVVKAMGGYTSNQFGASLFYAAPGDVEATEKVQTAIGSIAWEYKPNAALTITPRISYRYNKDDYIYTRVKPDLYHNVHETNVLSAEVNATYKLAKGIAGAGAEWRQEQIVSNSLGKRQRDNLGFYAEYQHFFDAHLSASAGAYLNSSSQFGTQLLPSVDAGYSFLRHWKIFANAGAGERLPTYTDLYYKGPGNIGNDSLKAEHALYIEGGLRYQQEAFSIQASYAYRHVTDFIDWVRASETDPWQPQNYQSVNTQLFSFRINADLTKLLALPDDYKLDVSTAYTYLNPAIEASNEMATKYVTEALRHQWITNIQALLWQHVQAGVGIRYQQRLNASDYTLLDARIGYKIPHFLFYADANNLLGVAYKEAGAVPLPGRWMTLGVRAAL